MRRRSAASASRVWAKAFSFTSICSRAASQACGDTIGGAFIAGCPAFSGDVCIVDLLMSEMRVARGRPIRPNSSRPGGPALFASALFRGDGVDILDNDFPALAHVPEGGLVLWERE